MEGETKGHEHRLDVQEKQYDFPYHYIPHFTESGAARRLRVLKWGFEYLCYQQHLIETVTGLNPKSLLEVGCGDGYFIGSIGDQVSERVGIDRSLRAIQFAQAFWPKVDFRVGDAAHLDKVFDVVVCIEVLEHIPDDDVSGFLRMLFDRARPGGHVVISVPSVVLPVNRKHFRHYNAKLLREQVLAASPGAETVREEFVCRVPHWMRIYDNITVNRFWSLDVPACSSWIWRRMWAKHRVADSRSGRHVVAVFSRRSIENQERDIGRPKD